MTTIQVDDKTADALNSIAKANGVTIEEYLRKLVHASDAIKTNSRDGEEFDRELDELSFSGPTLPVDFSRSDIYIDE